MGILRNNIRAMFIVSTVLLSSILLGLLTVLNIHQVSGNMEADVKALLTAKSSEISTRFDKRLGDIAGKTEGLSMTISALPVYDKALVSSVIHQIILSDFHLVKRHIYICEMANNINIAICLSLFK